MHDGIAVVRDDLIPGGTKRRFIDSFVLGAASEYVYASPAYGGAQIALAHAARAAGKRATVFVAKRNELHLRSREAQLAGAQIVEVPHGYLSNVQAKARAYATERGACLLPFGFDTEDALSAIARAALQVRWRHGVFDEVWSAMGSGVLTRGLQRSRLGRSYVAIAVGRDGSDAGAARVIKHPQPFADDARGAPPPFPSCSNYDRKAWHHVLARRAEDPRQRLLFWNVAR
jgi:hypothetical protein